ARVAMARRRGARVRAWPGRAHCRDHGGAWRRRARRDVAGSPRSGCAGGFVRRLLCDQSVARSALLRSIGLILPHRLDTLDLAKVIERIGTDAAVDDHETRVAFDAVETASLESAHNVVEPMSLVLVDPDGDINNV